VYRHSPLMRSLFSQSQTPTAPRRAVGFFRSGCPSGYPAWLITQSTSAERFVGTCTVPSSFAMRGPVSPAPASSGCAALANLGCPASAFFGSSGDVHFGLPLSYVLQLCRRFEFRVAPNLASIQRRRC